MFYTIKDRVIEEQVINGITHRRQQKVKVYGFDSSKSGRAELFELVNDRVEYHKDKVIDARIHEELCALRMDIKGRIDHPVGGHDDLVIAWALALYVLYRGGDIANDFGITRHMIKTDIELDEEIYEVSKGDMEVISDKLDIVDSPEAQVDEQLKVLASTPGQMSMEEWRRAEFAREQEAMRKILATKDGKRAYINSFNIDPESLGETVNVTIPNEVFNDFYMENNQMEQGVGRGNLYSAFMKVMGVR